jgi:hypothetical protein
LGVTVLAGWLGLPPSLQHATPPAAEIRDVRPVASDIQAQAERLQIRVRKELDYRDPARNPFRFGQRRAAPAAVRVAPAPLPEAPPAIELPVVQPLPFTLSGMATDGPEESRTAILTSGNDVVFAKAGDRVAGFTVTRVDENGIEVTAADGAVRRLTLTP